MAEHTPITLRKVDTGYLVQWGREKRSGEFEHSVQVYDDRMALLFAAAPDLLAACKGVEDCLCADCRYQNECSVPCRRAQILRDAIAKAEGKP